MLRSAALTVFSLMQRSSVRMLGRTYLERGQTLVKGLEHFEGLGPPSFSFSIPECAIELQ